MDLNTIYNEDCFAGMNQIPQGIVDLIIADPPYLIPNISGGGSINNVKLLNQSLADLKEKHDITCGYDISLFSNEVVNLQGKNINVYFFCNKAQIPQYFKVYVDKLKCKFEILTWHKLNALPTYYNKYLSDTEFCLYFHKGKGKTKPMSYEDAKTFYLGHINHKDKKRYGHPTIKPLELIEKLIKNSSNEGDLVLDPFMGSGTTAIGCINLKRNYIGFEINEDYYKTSIQRISEHTNRLALF